MSKSNRAFALCFRWFLAGFFTFLIVLPAIIALGVV
jgi:hypothetical protein